MALEMGFALQTDVQASENETRKDQAYESMNYACNRQVLMPDFAS